MAKGLTALLFSPLFNIGFVFVSTAVHITHSFEAFPMQCSSNASVNIMEIDSPNQEVFIHLNSDFKYLQICMKIRACYSYSILRGNRYITGNVVNANHTEKSVPLTLTHTMVNNGIHAYHIAIETQSINFTDVINTSVMCGKFQGYRLKAVGATLCTITDQQKQVIEPVQEPSKSRYSFENDHNSDDPSRLQLESTQDDSYTQSLKTINELHRWANGAYVMAICFTLTVYVLFLLAKMWQHGVMVQILRARAKQLNSHSPSDAV